MTTGPHASEQLWSIPPQPSAPWQADSPAAAAEPPRKPRRPIAALIAIAAVLVAGIVTTVVVLSRDDDADAAAQPSSNAETQTPPPTAAQDAARAAAIEKHATSELAAVSAHLAGTPANSMTISTTADTTFTTCEGDAGRRAHTLTATGVVDGTLEPGFCANGFDPINLPLSGIMTAIDAALSGGTIEVLVLSDNAYTPTLMVTVDGTYDGEYDLSGNELPPVIDPLLASDRQVALEALLAASGIVALTQSCVVTDSDSVYISGSTASAPDNVQDWRYTNLAQQLDSYQETDDLRFGPSDYDIAPYIEHAQTVSGTHTIGAEALGIVCISTYWDDQTPLAAYYYRTPQNYTGFDSVVYYTLDTLELVYEE